jgi:ribosomal protein S8E
MKKYIWLFGIFAVLFGIVGVVWYNTTLDDAQEKRKNVATREVEVKPKSNDTPKVNKPDTNTTKPTNSPKKETNPAPTKAAKPEVLTKGTFVELDPVHKGSGDVAIVQDGDKVLVEFQENFKVEDGPDLYVWLVKKQDLGGAVNGVNTKEGEYLNLGPLNKKSGIQSFAITEQEFQEFNYAVVIWCEAFGVQFTNAVL